MGQQLFAGDGEALDAAPPGLAALDQPRAGQRLELGQCLGHRRLTERQPLRGPRQMALLRHRHQTAQMPQLHAAREDLGRRRHRITIGYEKSKNDQFTSMARMNRVRVPPTMETPMTSPATPGAALPKLDPRDWESHPKYIYSGYKSTAKRGPLQPLIPLKASLGELQQPVYGHSSIGEFDHDLTRNARRNGEPIGERMILTGQVFDERR